MLKKRIIGIIKVLISAVVIATVIELGLKAILAVTLVVLILKRKQIIENMKLGGKFVECKLEESQNNK